MIDRPSINSAFVLGADRLAHRIINDLPVDDLFSTWDDDKKTRRENHEEFHEYASDLIAQAMEKYGGDFTLAIMPVCEAIFAIGRAFEEMNVHHLKATNNLGL